MKLNNFIHANTGCVDCGICIVHAGNNDFGCWQYTTANNNFRCIPSKQQDALLNAREFPEIEGLNTRSRWNTYSIANRAETCQINEGRRFSNLTCLQPGARLRFVRKDKNGNLDTKLSWELQDGIEHGSFLFWAWDGSEPEGTMLLADGTYR